MNIDINNNQPKKQQSVFWIELDKINPNPYQPRISFDEEKLQALANSIRQYGVLQPIVVSRQERYQEGVGISSSYEIIAGERRFRASKLAGLTQIPAIIREGEQTDSEKLELAIIENLQREDLNPIDKAKAFKKLTDEFGMTHNDIAEKMGKSREFVSNAMRLLLLPEAMQLAVSAKQISEGHTRPLLMLKDRPEEQMALFRKIVTNRLTVRAAEKIAREIAVEKVRKKETIDPEIKAVENKLAEKLGTKVSIEKKSSGESGKITIEFFSKEDLDAIVAAVRNNTTNDSNQDGSLQESTNSLLSKLMVSAAESKTTESQLKERQENVVNDFAETNQTDQKNVNESTSSDSGNSLYDAFLQSKEKMQNEEKEHRLAELKDKKIFKNSKEEEEEEGEEKVENIVNLSNNSENSVENPIKEPAVVINEQVFDKIKETIEDKEPETYTVMGQEEKIEGIEVTPVASGSDFLSAKTEANELAQQEATKPVPEEEANPEDLYNFKGFSV